MEKQVVTNYSADLHERHNNFCQQGDHKTHGQACQKNLNNYTMGTREAN